MELFERVLSLQAVLGNKSRIARILEISPQKLNAYSNETGQKNFLHRLPRLLKAIPNLNREWLYFGDGPMFIEEAQSEPTEDAQASSGNARAALSQEQLLLQIAQLTHTNSQLTESNRQLTEINRKLIDELMRRNSQGQEAISE